MYHRHQSSSLTPLVLPHYTQWDRRWKPNSVNFNCFSKKKKRFWPYPSTQTPEMVKEKLLPPKRFVCLFTCILLVCWLLSAFRLHSSAHVTNSMWCDIGFKHTCIVFDSSASLPWYFYCCEDTHWYNAFLYPQPSSSLPPTLKPHLNPQPAPGSCTEQPECPHWPQMPPLFRFKTFSFPP